MRALALLASVGVHVAVVVTAPRGRSPLHDIERSESEPTPVELIDARDLVRPAIETPPRAPLPEPALPEPAPPQPAPPLPLPLPPPPRPKPRVRPRAAPAPSTDSVAVPDPDPDPDSAGPTGDGTNPRAEPVRLALTLSNQSTPEPRPSGRGRAPRASSAKPACDQANTKPRPRTKVPVRYTRAARAAGLHGRLILRATVDAKGAVTRVEVLRSLGPEVDEPATAALRAWTFDPATACGRPVTGRFTIARDFTLAD